MKDRIPREVADGSWTMRAPKSKRGTWSILVLRQWVEDPRFRRACVELDEGPVIAISAEETRRALHAWLSDPQGRSFCLVRIDPVRRTVNGVPVQWEELATGVESLDDEAEPGLRIGWSALAGVAAFLLPALVTFTGLRLDHSAYRHNPTYRMLIPFVAGGAVLIAAIVPVVLIARARISRTGRVALSVCVLLLLALECGWLLLQALAGTH